ncbi:EP300-interacting inhibitor of differentiation 2-like [Manis pentadactyla]|uniref:EP300-interacting inhibitor of differentiation 2-like n=1 Tax=Manis pentadactyla TaxID=143292 RepID=UPI00255C2DCE|nr:EP300-interacting inhibitor of differentiation 2-like [Manis pentadactyla]XP_057360999.1 EP300-interacting inhibitor of differentiation 2-like [Manis pentadactyla]
MFALPANSTVPNTDAEDGDRNGLQAEVGGGPPEPARARPEEPGEGLMAAAREVPVAAAGAAGMAEVARLVAEPAEEEGQEGWPGNGPGLAALPHGLYRVLSVGEIIHLYQQLYVMVVEVQEPELRGRFVEADFDAEYLWNPPRIDFDVLTGITMTPSAVIDPLVEELGCDKLIRRE